MQFSLEFLVAVATIVGTVTSILAVIQSRAWLVFTSLLFVCLSIAAGLYARKKRLALNAASTETEGHSIDSLNIANLKRRVNRTLVIQEAHHTVLSKARIWESLGSTRDTATRTANLQWISASTRTTVLHLRI